MVLLLGSTSKPPNKGYLIPYCTLYSQDFKSSSQSKPLIQGCLSCLPCLPPTKKNKRASFFFPRRKKETSEAFLGLPDHWPQQHSAPRLPAPPKKRRRRRKKDKQKQTTHTHTTKRRSKNEPPGREPGLAPVLGPRVHLEDLRSSMARGPRCRRWFGGGFDAFRTSGVDPPGVLVLFKVYLIYQCLF